MFDEGVFDDGIKVVKNIRTDLTAGRETPSMKPSVATIMPGL